MTYATRASTAPHSIPCPPSTSPYPQPRTGVPPRTAPVRPRTAAPFRPVDPSELAMEEAPVDDMTRTRRGEGSRGQIEIWAIESSRDAAQSIASICSYMHTCITQQLIEL